jgi:hypothetical protein
MDSFDPVDNPVEIERWLEVDCMRKLDLMEHRRFLRELDKIALLDAVPVQPWEVKVSRRIKFKRAWV